MLHSKKVGQSREEKELARDRQRRDARPRLNVHEAHAVFRHHVRHLEQVNRHGDEEARRRPVGEDHRRVPPHTAAAALGSRQQRRQDVQHAAQRAQRRGEDALGGRGARG
ncbi:hypothetical protein NLG97_g7741 [Lecanicillium saksenae]|uniref:Uncharacterized protein n=1 Tax=Lecanicillium saksenae TaxID=468837 RepID=A0ACC1QKY9_9HYPO|nr:hypothetical protein NLG97_g7741 [Lecanicillium saksenae]